MSSLAATDPCVHLVADGIELPEIRYTTKDLTRTWKYVEATDNQKFQVLVKVPSDYVWRTQATCLSFAVFVDSLEITRTCVTKMALTSQPRETQVRIIEGPAQVQERGATEKVSMMFVPVPNNVPRSQDIGSRRISLTWCGAMHAEEEDGHPRFHLLPEETPTQLSDADTHMVKHIGLDHRNGYWTIRGCHRIQTRFRVASILYRSKEHLLSKKHTGQRTCRCPSRSSMRTPSPLTPFRGVKFIQQDPSRDNLDRQDEALTKRTRIEPSSDSAIHPPNEPLAVHPDMGTTAGLVELATSPSTTPSQQFLRSDIESPEACPPPPRKPNVSELKVSTTF